MQATELTRLQEKRDEAFRNAERVWFESQVRFNQWHQSCQEYEKAREALEAAEAALSNAAFNVA